MNRPGGFTITDRGLELCAFPQGARLLDVGCGRGETVRHLRAAGFEGLGVDRDVDVIRGAAHLSCARAEALPFADGSMEGVLMECSLSVTEDPGLALAECRRVLRLGGRLLLTDVYARGHSAELKGCLGRVETRTELERRFAAAGFRLAHVEDFSGHLRAFWGQRLLEHGPEALCAD
ncbi:MAG TPA: methyltransferase domain-containing protein, partial [Holophaga sp.]|nr:methyltransferase domain-containing protein [Holophaga sp.]